MSLLYKPSVVLEQEQEQFPACLGPSNSARQQGSSAHYILLTLTYIIHLTKPPWFYTPWQRWALVPGFAFPHSRGPGILGTRARGNAHFIQERGNAERERIGTINMRSCEEMTQLWRVLRGEVEGGDCGQDVSLTPNRLPASRLVHRVCETRGVSGAVASWPGPPDQSIHTQRACDELLPHPHTYTTSI